MSQFFSKKILLLLFLIIILSFFLLGLDEFFSIYYIKQNSEFIQSFIDKNFLYSLLIFYSLFLLLLCFFLPFSAIMLIFSGYSFNLYLSIPLSIIIITIGGLSNFLLLKKINLIVFFNKAKFWLKKISFTFKDNEFQYLLLLRLIPIPFIIQNAITVILNISEKKFFFSTMLGIVPYTVIYSLAGLQLRKIIDKSESITISDILNYENFSVICLLAIFILLSIFLKKKLIKF
mgnify:CR=1 FL=1